MFPGNGTWAVSANVLVQSSQFDGHWQGPSAVTAWPPSLPDNEIAIKNLAATHHGSLDSGNVLL